MRSEHLFINIKGYLLDLDIPKVMGILNVTPDSFYSGSRNTSEEEIRKRVERMLEEGVDIIDLGGCSTRPGFEAPSVEEEWERVDQGCKVIRSLASEIPLSIDTFRAEIAERAIEKWGADIINDVTGGEGDNKIWETVAKNKVAYVLTHNRIPANFTYTNITAEVITELSKKVNELHRQGVNDVIIDPGFGFSKTLEANFELFAGLNEVARMGLPLMVGVSRKSMIFKSLGVNPEDSLTGTIALDAIALEKGANILRVHDVKEARQTVELYRKIKEYAV